MGYKIILEFSCEDERKNKTVLVDEIIRCKINEMYAELEKERVESIYQHELQIREW